MDERLYREKILDHYKDPHHHGEIPDPDAEGRAANPSCGDDITFQFCIEDGIITDIGFSGDGCALSVATASMLTDELIDQPVTEVKKLSSDTLFELLGIEKDAISPMRMKCVVLSKDAVEQAMNDSED